MTKANKNTIYTPLIVTGYILLGALIAGVLVSTTVPFSQLLFSPGTKTQNVWVALVTLTLGAIVPPLVGYFLGGTSARKGDIVQRHTNGVFFILLSYWVVSVLSTAYAVVSGFIDFGGLSSTVIMAAVPIVGVSIVVGSLALSYTRHARPGQGLLEYPPYVAALGAFTVGTAIAPLLSALTEGGPFNFLSLLSVVTVLVLGAVLYVTLQKARISRLEKIGWTATGVSMFGLAWFAMTPLVQGIATQAFPYGSMQVQAATSWIAAAVVVAGWVTYWLFQVHALRSSKK